MILPFCQVGGVEKVLIYLGDILAHLCPRGTRAQRRSLKFLVNGSQFPPVLLLFPHLPNLCFRPGESHSLADQTGFNMASYKTCKQNSNGLRWKSISLSLKKKKKGKSDFYIGGQLTKSRHSFPKKKGRMKIGKLLAGSHPCPSLGTGISGEAWGQSPASWGSVHLQMPRRSILNHWAARLFLVPPFTWSVPPDTHYTTSSRVFHSLFCPPPGACSTALQLVWDFGKKLTKTTCIHKFLYDIARELLTETARLGQAQ